MRVLGIDASLSRTALCALTWDGHGLEASSIEVIPTQGSWTLTRRLRALANAAYRIAKTDPPTLVVVEEPGFVGPGGPPIITALGRAQGALIAGLPPDVERVETVRVATLRSRLGLHVPRGKGQAKPATRAFVEARGLRVPVTSSALGFDDDVADAYALGLYGLLLLGVTPPATVSPAEGHLL